MSERQEETKWGGGGERGGGRRGAAICATPKSIGLHRPGCVALLSFVAIRELYGQMSVLLDTCEAEQIFSEHFNFLVCVLPGLIVSTVKQRYGKTNIP